MGICLCMIVRNEGAVIERALASVRPYLQTWRICDTGSTDNTVALIRTALAEIPGDLVHRPWRNFGHNRTEALQLGAMSGADYLLMLDADQTLSVDCAEVLTGLDGAGYQLLIRHAGMSYPNTRLVRADLDWRFAGVTHEYILCREHVRVDLLEGVTIWEHGDSNRRVSLAKSEDDLRLLAAGLLAEPYNGRYLFYLAQTLRDLGRWDEAVVAYDRRIDAGGWAPEVWYSRYQIARILDKQGKTFPAMASYSAAYAAESRRAEPLYWWAALHQRRGEHQQARQLLDYAVDIPRPVGDLFVEDGVYEALRVRRALAQGGLYTPAGL